jgi:hypothetical protein
MRKNALATMFLCTTSALLMPALAAQPAPGDNLGYNISYQFMAVASPVIREFAKKVLQRVRTMGVSSTVLKTGAPNDAEVSNPDTPLKKEE